MSNGNNIYVGKLKDSKKSKDDTETNQELFDLGLQNIMDLTGIRIWGETNLQTSEKAPYRVYVGDTQVYPEDIHKKLPFSITYSKTVSQFSYNFTEDSDILNRWHTGFWLDVDDIGSEELVKTTTTVTTIESAYPWFVDKIISTSDFGSFDRSEYMIPSYIGLDGNGLGFISSVGKRQFRSDVDTYVQKTTTMTRKYDGNYDIGNIDTISNWIYYYGVSKKLEQLEPYINKKPASGVRYAEFNSSTGKAGKYKLKSPYYSLDGIGDIGIRASDHHLVGFLPPPGGSPPWRGLLVPDGGSGKHILGAGSIITTPSFYGAEVHGSFTLSPNYPEYASYDEWLKDITTDGIYPNKKYS
jgi:hypothetical protein